MAPIHRWSLEVLTVPEINMFQFGGILRIRFLEGISVYPMNIPRWVLQSSNCSPWNWYVCPWNSMVGRWHFLLFFLAHFQVQNVSFREVYPLDFFWGRKIRPNSCGVILGRSQSVILLMVQKSEGQPPFGCIKPVVNNEINYHINWLVGFLNHQQYLCQIYHTSAQIYANFIATSWLGSPHPKWWWQVWESAPKYPKTFRV